MTDITKPAEQVRRVAVLFGLLCVFVAPAQANAANSPAKSHSLKAKGIVVAKTSTTVTVCVGTARKSTSKRAAALRGRPVVFDITSAKLKVNDLNGDGRKTLADLLTGARVDVKTHKVDIGASPLAAKRVAVSTKAKKAAEYAGGVCASAPPVAENVTPKPVTPKPEEPRKPGLIDS